jgi:protein phosphatase
MLLTITTTHSPATDLGFLLEKHPDKVHEFELTASGGEGSGKRSLAEREFCLGIEALTRFVKRQPLRHVHECVFGVLALESEPVDPRL